MKRTKFDIFLCYAKEDRNLAEKIVAALRKQEILVLDVEEIKPEDSLLNHIMCGIENANYSLLLISEHSLNSSWIQYELNAAMIEEVEKQHIKLLPAIIGKIEYEQLKPDIRAKYCLDFRDDKNSQKSVLALVDLIQPERRKREELLRQLRNPRNNDAGIFHQLQEYTLHHKDQTIQIAAMNGLAEIGGPKAVVIIAERLLYNYGVRGVESAIKMLVKLRDDGGLLALSGTLISNSFPSYYWRRLEALAEGAKKLGAEKDAQMLMTLRKEAGTIYDLRDTVPLALDKMATASLEDIRNGALLAKGVIRARIFSPRPTWAGQIILPEASVLNQARDYALERVPGLLNLIWTG